MGDTLVLQGSTAVPIIVAGRPIGRRPPAAPSAVIDESAGPARSTTDSAEHTRLTLTRRGRLLLVGFPVALGIAVLIVLGAFLTSEAQAGEGPAQSSPTISVTVAADETLWSLASHHAPDRDPRDVVAEMVELNNLRSSVVQAGQTISIPSQG